MRENPSFRSGRLKLDYGHVETRGVLAGAYLPRHFDSGEPTFLTHLVFIGPAPRYEELRTGCRQPVDNIVDVGGASAERLAERPTCPTCAKKWEKISPELRGDVRGWYEREQNASGARSYQLPNAFDVHAPLAKEASVVVDFENPYEGDGFNLVARAGEIPDEIARRYLARAWPGLENAKLDIKVRLKGKRGYERNEREPNGGHYVWIINASGDPVPGEGPYGPFERGDASSFARIGATKGEHNRVVTRGLRPEHAGFKLVAEYEARTGAKRELR